MNREEYAFAYNINSTGLSGIITMTNTPKLVCYCDEENSKTILNALNPPLPPAEGAEQRIRVRNILQDFYRRGEYELEQAEEDIMRLFQQQPTAEGAEEIEAELRGYARDIVRLHKPIMEVNPQLAMDSIGNDLVKMFNRLAQRIADKMVSERLREELIGFMKYCSATNIATMGQYAIDGYLKTRDSHDR